MKNPMIDFFAARLKEPTTWGGLIVILTGIGVHLSPEMSNAIISTGVAVGGLLMILLKEAGSK